MKYGRCPRCCQAAKQPLCGNLKGQLANRTSCRRKDRVRDSRSDGWHACLTYTAGRFAAAHNVHIDLRHIAQSAEMRPADASGMAALTVPLVSPLAISGPDINETLRIADLLVRVGRMPFGASSAIKAPARTIFVGVKPPFVIGQARPVLTAEKRVPQRGRATRLLSRDLWMIIKTASLRTL